MNKSNSTNVIQSKTTRTGYWNIQPVLGTKSDINLIVGQRSNGKTYGVLKYFLQEYKRLNRRFVYVRRWHDDVKASLAGQLFEPLAEEVEKLFGEGFSVYYFRGCFYLVNDKGKKVDTVGYVIDLSTAHHTKSVPYVDVKYILFDEFIQMSGDERLLPNELQKWDNVLSTIIRQKTDVVIFLVANTVSKFSPYFSHYGFDINKCEQGTITTKEFPTDNGILRISLEYCSYSEVIGKKVSKYTVSKMIKTGQWEIPETDDIPTSIGERVKEKLLFTIYDPEAKVTIGCYVRRSLWETIETEPNTGLMYAKSHVREFLVLHMTEKRSKYHHLSNCKSLDYNTYNDLEYMLKDIKETCDIDVVHELYMGRIFSDNMYTADYFNHCWLAYGMVNPRSLL